MSDGETVSTLESLSLPRVVIVVGTGHGVGTTTATAALAAALTERGSRIRAVTPVQTGRSPEETGDADTIAELAGVPAQEWHRVADPLVVEGSPLPPMALHARRVAEADEDVVLVEGSGGLLARLDGRGGTIADLGTALRYKGISTGVVLVTAPWTGDAIPDVVADISLVGEALRHRQLPLLGVVVGDAPAHGSDRAALDRVSRATGVPLLGILPHGLTQDRTMLRSQALSCFSPENWETMPS